jgi:hypothetical protein
MRLSGPPLRRAVVSVLSVVGRTRSRASRLRRRARLVLLAALLVLAGSSQIDIASAQAQACPQPIGLSPTGDATTRFTMLIRVNQKENLVNPTSGLATAQPNGTYGRTRPQDIFVVNTRFVKSDGTASTPSDWIDLVTRLRTAFPCNRIISLNGLSLNSATAGYRFALYGQPGVHAVMLDWEPDDWAQAQLYEPALGPWDQKFRTALGRIREFTGNLSATIAGGANPGARAGLIPIDLTKWNYGQIAQKLDKQNRRLGGRHLAPQSVQTQSSCQRGGFGPRAKQILAQYRFKFIKRKVKRKGKKKTITIKRKIKKKARPKPSNLSLQISFSDTPDPANPLPIASTAPSTAAACATGGLSKGAGAFFFFASDQSIRALLAQPSICALRPPAPGQPC